MSKFVQAFLSGVFFTFFLDFFLFLGIKLNYIDFYNINLYYNILFADNQNIYIYLVFSAVFGFLITYVNNAKLSIIVIGGLFVLTLTTLIPQVGNKVGFMILATQNINLHDTRYTYQGDIYYDGRKQITFYDYGLKKIITLNKKDLK